jgi:hypothetical protein
MAMDRRAALRAGVLGVGGALAGCLGPVGEDGRVPTESPPRSVLRVTDDETVRFAVRRSVGWDEASGFVVLVDSAARQRALLTKYRLPDDRRDRILEFLEDVDYGRERLVLVESVGPDQCHDALEVEAVEVGDGGITAEATVRTSDADDCGQALAYPSSLLRARFNAEPPDEATVEVTDGRGGTSTVTATAGDPLSPAPEDLPGNVRPAADAEPVPSLDCETAGAERHDQRFDEADLAWGDYPGEGSPRLAIRVDDLTYGHGETLNVSLTNVAEQPVETGNSARYNLQVDTEAGWADVRVTTGDGFGYADESVAHGPGEGFDWSIELSEEGIIEASAHGNAEVCPDLRSGRYRFAYWGVEEGAVAVAFDLEARGARTPTPSRG